MGKWFHNKYFYTFLTVICSGAGILLLYYIFFENTDFGNVFGKTVSILSPIIYGFAMAYIMTPLMNFLEAKVVNPLFAKLKLKLNIISKKKCIRLTSMILTFFVYGLCVFLFFRTMVPQVISSIETFVSSFPTYVTNTANMIDAILKDYPAERELFEKYFDDYSIEIQTYITTDLLPTMRENIMKMTNNIFTTAIGFIKVVFNLLIGVIVSAYLLYRKEQFAAQSKKIVYSVFNENSANAIINEVRFIHKTFTGFFTGKILDSIIVGIICFIVTTIMHTPYALLVSLIVGVTNIIPFFGPLIGAIPSTLIILMVNPNSALAFVIFVFILQQFDGNILGPKILGDSTGLPSFWVLFSITLFGGLFGILGILLGVPVFAVIYNAIKRFASFRLKGKGLPEGTTPYTYVDNIKNGNLIMMGEKNTDL